MGVKIIRATKQTRTMQARPGSERRQDSKLLRVAAYCRVSTDSEEQETSYEAQCLHYESFIESHPAWELAGIYADEGITGTMAKKRPAFLRMIEDCRGREIDMVITKSISRFSRNTVDCLKYIRLLKDMRIPILFEKEGINTMESSGEVLLTILASISQQECKSISDNVRMGIEYNFQQGKGMLNTSAFLGYNRGETPHSLVIDPGQAQVVRRIYREYLAGFSPSMIAARLGADGIRTVTGKAVWHPSTIDSILTNEKYCGDLLMQKYYTMDFFSHRMARNRGKRPQYFVEDDHDPIVPKAVFFQVQAERHRRGAADPARSRSAGTMALTRRVYCGLCGGLLSRSVRTDGAQAVWRCCGKASGEQRGEKEARCGCRSVKETALKAAVTEAFCRLPGRWDALLVAQERERGGAAGIDALLEAEKNGRRALEERASALAERPDEEAGEEQAFIREQLEQSRVRSEALYARRAEAAGRQIRIRMLLELTEQMLERGSLQWRRLFARPEEAAPVREAACRDLDDFFSRTRYAAPAGLLDEQGHLTAFDNELVIRFIDRVTVLETGFAVGFKAGISVTVREEAVR